MISPGTQRALQLRRRTLMVVFVREEGKCFYCDVPVSLKARRYIGSNSVTPRIMNAATLDHIIPKSRGGSDEPDNCVCACYGCNTDRKDRPAVDFLYERRA